LKPVTGQTQSRTALSSEAAGPLKPAEDGKAAEPEPGRKGGITERKQEGGGRPGAQKQALSRPVPPARSSPLRGYLLVALAAVLWGTLGIFARLLYRLGYEPQVVVFFRASIAFAGFFFWVLLEDRRLFRITLRDIPFFALYGFVSITLFYTVYFYTLKITPVAVATILLYTAPIFVNLLAWIFLGERLTPGKLRALALAVLGIFFIIQTPAGSGWGFNWLSLAGGLASAITYGLYSIFGKKALVRYDPMTILVYTLGFGSLFLGLLLGPQRLVSLHLTPESWRLLLAVGVIPTLLSFWAYTRGLQLVEAGRASIVATLEPVAATVFAIIFLGEGLSVWQVIGGLLVIGGAVSAQSQG